MSGLGGGAVSPGPVVVEVAEPGIGEGNRELFEACRSGDLERVQKLVTAENVNSLDTMGRKSTPLHFAAGETPAADGSSEVTPSPPHRVLWCVIWTSDFKNA